MRSPEIPETGFLRRICLLPGDQKPLPCTCPEGAVNSCYRGDPYEAVYSSISFKEADKFIKARWVCEKVGIDLVLVGEDDVLEDTEEWKKYLAEFDW